MKRTGLLAVSFAAFAFLSACSNNNNNGSPGITCPGATGNFTNASLGANGTQWAYELSGWFVNSSGNYSPYTEAGVFAIDGRGNITSGFDDYFGSTSVSGSYSVISNGTGTINLNISNSSGTQPLVWGITLANPGVSNSTGSLALIEGDSFANAHGAAYQQSSSTLTTSPTGTFAFRTHVTPSGTIVAQSSVGAINFANNLTVSGSDDWVSGSGQGGQFTGFAGSFTAPTGGIGSVTFTDGLGVRTFDYYVIDANDLILYETDNVGGGLGMGRAEAQQIPTGGFTNANFTGSFVFGTRGDTSAGGAGAINSVGQLAADGAANITGGSLDSVVNGAAQLAQTFAATTYTVVSSGRLTSTLSASVGGSISIAGYLVSPTRGFFLITNDVTTVADGTIDQQSGSLSTGSFSGQYAFLMGGLVPATGGGTIPLDRTGTIQADGNGNLGWAEQVNSGGNPNAVCLVGNYSAGTSGRLTGTVSTLSNSLVFYLISPNAGYALQADPQTQMMGGMVNQSQPITVIPGAF